MKNATLKYYSPITLISEAIRYSKATWEKTDSFGDCPVCNDESVEYNVKERSFDKMCRACGDDFQELSPEEQENIYNEIQVTEYFLGNDDRALIERVAFNMFHQSVLSHSLITFNVTGSTKFLLDLLSEDNI